MPRLADLVTELPDALVARPATLDDAQTIYELIVACELEDDGVVDIDRSDVDAGFERHGFDPATDTVLVFDSGVPVAWAELYRGRAEGDVVPARRGRGIGAALLGWIEARARALGDPSVGQTTSDGNAGARELFLANGYAPTWTSWIIRIELTEPPQPPDVPPGISIRAYEPSDARAVHEVIDAAFSEWEGRDREPFEVWAPMVLGHRAFEPATSPLAFDADELVGVVISYDYPGEGWIQQVATKATHRRRGIAQALLGWAFVSFHEQGHRLVGVSTDTRTGALDLYEKVGMSVVQRYTRYTKHLTGRDGGTPHEALARRPGRGPGARGDGRRVRG